MHHINVDENESNDITKVVTGILNKTESMIAKSFKTIKTSEKTSEKGQQCSTQDVLVQVIKPLPKEEFDHRQDPHGRDYYWLTGKFTNMDKGEDTDEWALANNYVSLVPVQFDLTAHHAIQPLNSWDFS